MELDDAYDAALTTLGEDQAMEAGRQEYIKRTLSNVEMVVSVSERCVRVCSCVLSFLFLCNRFDSCTMAFTFFITESII